MSFIFVCALLFPLISAGEFSLQDPFPSHFSAFRSLLLRVFSFHFDICYILQPSHLKAVESSILPLKQRTQLTSKLLQGVVLFFIYVEKNPSTYWEVLAMVGVKSSGHFTVSNENGTRKVNLLLAVSFVPYL